MNLWDEFLEEVQDTEKEYIRYLSKDLALLHDLKAEFKDDWELEEMLSLLIHEEANLIDSCKRRWMSAAKRKAEPERVPGARPDNIQPRNADAFIKGNLFMDKSQIKDAEP
jgi:hypothetical protein